MCQAESVYILMTILTVAFTVCRCSDLNFMLYTIGSKSAVVQTSSSYLLDILMALLEAICGTSITHISGTDAGDVLHKGRHQDSCAACAADRSTDQSTCCTETHHHPQSSITTSTVW